MKLTEFENPLTGKKSNLFDVGSLWSQILGVVMLFVVFAMGQNVARKISSKVPAIDTTIEPIISRPVTNTGLQKRFV
jgi:predicted solute-binding protein